MRGTELAYIRIQPKREPTLVRASPATSRALLADCVSCPPPSLVQVKARILKHTGDVAAASATLEAGRVLDLADRYVNSKSTKYLLRAGDPDKALEVVSLFTKHEGDEQTNLQAPCCLSLPPS